jgi:hypothetical protein
MCITLITPLLHPYYHKKRIESLIERDYLERDAEDSAFYKYLA